MPIVCGRILNLVWSVVRLPVIGFTVTLWKGELGLCYAAAFEGMVVAFMF